MKKENILGFDVCNNSEDELINEIFADYNNNIQNVIVNINPEIVVNNYKDKKIISKFNSEKFQIPDGVGIIYASKLNKGQIKKRIPGIDLMKKICEESIKYNSRIFLYGTQPDIIEKAKEELEKTYSGIQIIGVCNGFIDEDVAVERIKATKPDILFVGTGSPKQENFIFNNKDKLSTVKIFMPVGGSFDVISNCLKRAPECVTKMNLEWLYRLIKQPKRIFRQLKLVKFIYYVIISKLNNKKTIT